MENNRLWELIAKRISGEADPAELKELDGLLAANSDALYTIEVMEGYLKSDSHREMYAEREAALERNLAKLKELPSVPVRSRWSSIIFGYPARLAATFVLGIGLFITIYKLATMASGENDAHPKTIVASRGSKNQVTLPDGSRVTLNAGSTLTYGGGYMSDSIRSVTLEGEGYFEIKHDSLHPFIIHTETMDIRDIGTAFNVRSYPGEPTAEATLIEGSIEVTMVNSTVTSVLDEPLQKIQVLKKDQQKSVSIPGEVPGNDEYMLIRTRTSGSLADSLLAETAWLEDVLVFNNERFEDIALRMERWYDVDIRFENEQLKNVRLTGVFSSETIKEALDEIRLMKPFRYTLVNGIVTIN